MRKHIFGKQLQRDSNERKALFKSLVSALVVHERIKTTEAKAKAVRGQIEKMVTKARGNAEEARRMFQGYFTQPILEKFMSDVTPRFANRPGGYTRIIKLGNRFGDAAKVVILEWVEKPVKVDIINPETKGTVSKASVSKTEKMQATVKTASKVKSSAKQNSKEKKSVKSPNKKNSSSGGK